MMKRILVATDFSTRSDRALQRASLLARQFHAALVLVNVVDDDQPRRLLEAERREATALIEDIARTVRGSVSVDCEAHVATGEPFRSILEVAGAVEAELIVIGPHRRRILGDIFVGTTAERTVRHSRHPVLMANAIPAGAYDRIVLATDFSECSRHAVETVKRLGLLEAATVFVAHAFDALFEAPIVRSAMSMQEHQDYVDRERKRAEKEMRGFLETASLPSVRSVVELAEFSPALTIQKVAQRERANLVVVGTRGKSGAERFLLGSVAEEMFRQGDLDVLAVPPLMAAA